MAFDELLCHIGSPLPFVPPGAVPRAPHAGGVESRPPPPPRSPRPCGPPRRRRTAALSGTELRDSRRTPGAERGAHLLLLRRGLLLGRGLLLRRLLRGRRLLLRGLLRGRLLGRRGPGLRRGLLVGLPRLVFPRQSSAAPRGAAACAHLLHQVVERHVHALRPAAPRRRVSPAAESVAGRFGRIQGARGGPRCAEGRGSRPRRCPTGPQPQCTPAARPRTAGGSAADRVNGRPPRGPPRPQGGSRERAKRGDGRNGATPRSRRTRSGAPRRRSPRPTSTPRGRGPGPSSSRGPGQRPRPEGSRGAAGRGRAGAGRGGGSPGLRWCPLAAPHQRAPGFGWPPTCSSGSAGGFPAFGGMASRPAGSGSDSGRERPGHTWCAR